MKKILVMSALVAISTAFVACSNENDLVQQKPEVPETPTERYPITVTVSDPTSRGTDLTADDLTSFSMYSTIDASWQATTTSKLGAAFAKNPTTGVWSNTNGVETTWPSQTTDYTFYAVNDVTNMTSAPTVTSSSVSFGYAMPQSQDANDDWYYDYTKQVDLLVAKETTNYNAGDPNKGTINVTFNHALALIKKIKVYCSYQKMDDNSMTGISLWHFRVNGIKLGGLKAAGTYTFDRKDPEDITKDAPWVVSGDDAEFEIPLDETKLTFDDMTFVAGDKTHNAVVLPLKDDGIYLIPQEAEGHMTYLGSNVYSWTGAYAILDLQSATVDTEVDPIQVTYEIWDKAVDLDNYDPDDPSMDPSLFGTGWDEESSNKNGFQKVRVPLNFVVEPGKGYTLVIDITNAISAEDGPHILLNESIFGDAIEINI